MFKTLSILLFLWLIIPTTSAIPAAEDDENKKKSTYLDLDGDGINDNASDFNNDGIPDSFGEDDSDGEIDTTIMTSSLTSFDDFGGGFDPEPSVEIDFGEQNSVKFSALTASVIPLTQRRGGLNSGEGFGPQNMAGSSGGVVCEGGVCRPR